jgi:hypothetical protein
MLRSLKFAYARAWWIVFVAGGGLLFVLGRNGTMDRWFAFSIGATWLVFTLLVLATVDLAVAAHHVRNRRHYVHLVGNWPLPDSWVLLPSVIPPAAFIIGLCIGNCCW